MLSGTHLGEHIVALKIGDAMADHLRQHGSSAVGPSRWASASVGVFRRVRSRFVERAELENVFRDGRRSGLIETYTPLRAESRTVLAVAGFSIPPTAWANVRAAQLRTWGVLGAITLAMLVLLATLVRKANDTVTATQRGSTKKSRSLRCWRRTSISTTG